MTTTTTRAATKAVPESRYVPEDGLLLDPDVETDMVWKRMR